MLLAIVIMMTIQNHLYLYTDMSDRSYVLSSRANTGHDASQFCGISEDFRELLKRLPLGPSGVLILTCDSADLSLQPNTGWLFSYI